MAPKKDKVFAKQLEQFGTEAYVLQQSVPQREESREAQIGVVRGLMETVQGRQWLWEKLDLCRVFGSTFIPDKPNVGDYLQGVRDIGLNLYQEINAAAPDKIFMMNQEAAERILVAKKKLKPEEATNPSSS